MHKSVMEFGTRILTADVVAGKNVCEIGALDVNGSLRPHVEALQPESYVGVDMQRGRGVDVVRDAVDYLYEQSHIDGFDIIICTEMLEHAERWRSVWRACAVALVARHGWLLLTTRSPGFPRHEHPNDYWRFSRNQLTSVAEYYGFTPGQIGDDPEAPGVFMWVQKSHQIGELRRMPAINAYPAPEK